MPQKHIISILSNKGGVGKTVFAIELANSLGQRGYKTLLIDTDINTGDIGIKLRLSYPQTLLDFFQKSVDDFSKLIQKVHSFYLVPGSGGNFKFANLNYQQKLKFIRSFKRVSEKFDYTILDLGAGIERTTLDFALTADIPVIITTPEDIQTGYGCAKATAVRMYELDQRMAQKDPDFEPRKAFAPGFVFNKCPRSLAEGIFQGIERATQVTSNSDGIHIQPRLLGSIPEDSSLIEKAYLKAHKPILVDYPRSRFGMSVASIRQLMEDGTSVSGSARTMISPLERIMKLFKWEKDYVSTS